jgi:hypothetical protein
MTACNSLMQRLCRSRERAPEPHCKAWNLAFFEKIHTRLPVELRSMIYAHLWDEATLASTYRLMSKSLTGLYRGNYETYHLVKEHPHYMKPAYVGSRTALEVVEAWYRAMGRSTAQRFVINKVRQLERFVTEDVFFVGLYPAKVVRRLDIELNMRDLFLSPDDTMDGDRTMARYYVEFLYRIGNKKGFKLNIKLEQRRIFLNMWPLALEVLGPVVRTFKNEGAYVRIHWTHMHSSPQLAPHGSPQPAPHEIELDSFIETPSLDWKTDVIANLDEVSPLPLFLEACAKLINHSKIG